MRIKIGSLKRLIRETVERLVEAKCPACGDPNAYVGATDVECPNPECRKPRGFFTQRQYDDVHVAGKIPVPDLERPSAVVDGRGFTVTVPKHYEFIVDVDDPPDDLSILRLPSGDFAVTGEPDEVRNYLDDITIGNAPELVDKWMDAGTWS